MFADALREWAWPCEHIFTRFTQNCNTGHLVALYSSAMHVALSTGAIPSFAVLHIERMLLLVTLTLQSLEQCMFSLHTYTHIHTEVHTSTHAHTLHTQCEAVIIHSQVYMHMWRLASLTVATHFNLQFMYTHACMHTHVYICIQVLFSLPWYILRYR